MRGTGGRSVRTPAGTAGIVGRQKNPTVPIIFPKMN
jgi:hypothetical protein